jgi:hypothetical protein
VRNQSAARKFRKPLTVSTIVAHVRPQAKSRIEKGCIAFPQIHTSDDGYGLSLYKTIGKRTVVTVFEEIAAVARAKGLPCTITPADLRRQRKERNG